MRAWKTAPLSQCFSALAVGSLLFLSGLLFWMQSGLKPILTRLKGEQVVTAYLSGKVEAKNERAILEEVRLATTSGGATGVDIKLVSTSEFLSHLHESYPELSKELAEMGKDAGEIVPRYISVSGVFANSALDKIRNIPGIESAESSKDRYHHVVGAFSALRWVVRILMMGVVLALMTGLIHLSRMNIYLQKNALVLLKFWGADPKTLAIPGVISGVAVGLVGGAIASGGWITLGFWLTQQIRNLSSMLKEMPSVSTDFAIVLFLVGGGVGLLSGILGSFSISSLQGRGGFED